MGGKCRQGIKQERRETGKAEGSVTVKAMASCGESLRKEKKAAHLRRQPSRYGENLRGAYEKVTTLLQDCASIRGI